MPTRTPRCGWRIATGDRWAASAACVDQFFNEYQNASWGWVGFFESIDDAEVTHALFDTACAWVAERGAETAVGPASFTTNDELGLLVEGFEDPPLMLTTQNPPYYEHLWVDYGWEQSMDLWAWELDRSNVGLSERQRRTLARIRERTKLNVRGMKMSDFNAEVGRLFDVYNAAWSKNWGFAPMPEAEVRHLAKQLKQIVDPELALVIEKPDGEPVAVAIILPRRQRADDEDPQRALAADGLVPPADRPEEGPPGPDLRPRGQTRSAVSGPRTPALPGDARPALGPGGPRLGRGVVDPGQQRQNERDGRGRRGPSHQDLAALRAPAVTARAAAPRRAVAQDRAPLPASSSGPKGQGQRSPEDVGRGAGRLPADQRLGPPAIEGQRAAEQDGPVGPEGQQPGPVGELGSGQQQMKREAHDPAPGHPGDLGRSQPVGGRHVDDPDGGTFPAPVQGVGHLVLVEELQSLGGAGDGGHGPAVPGHRPADPGVGVGPEDSADAQGQGGDPGAEAATLALELVGGVAALAVGAHRGVFGKRQGVVRPGAVDRRRRGEDDPGRPGAQHVGGPGQVHVRAAAAPPQGEPEVPQHVDAFQGRPGSGVAQVGAGVHQLGVLGQPPTGDGPDPADVGIGQQDTEQPAAEMAGRTRQSNVDRASSKATSTSWMCSGVWVAITDVRSSARPAGTAGAMAQLV